MGRRSVSLSPVRLADGSEITFVLKDLTENTSAGETHHYVTATEATWTNVAGSRVQILTGLDRNSTASFRISSLLSEPLELTLDRWGPDSCN